MKDIHVYMQGGKKHYIYTERDNNTIITTYEYLCQEGVREMLYDFTRHKLERLTLWLMVSHLAQHIEYVHN